MTSDNVHPAPADHDTPSAQKSRPRVGRRRRMRRLAWVGGIFVLVLLLFIALLPTLLSTAWGNRRLVSWADGRIAGSVDAERIHFGWFEGPTVTNLTLHDPQGRLVADVPHIAAREAQPLYLLFGSRTLGDVQVRVNRFAVHQARGEPMNVQFALAPPEGPEPDDEPMQLDENLSGDIEITADSITYESEGIDRVELNEFTARLNVQDVQNISASMSSELRQGDTTGQINVTSFNVRDLFSEQGDLQWQRAHVVDADAELTNVPVAPLDRIANQHGRWLTTVGPQFDRVRLRAEGPVDNLSARVEATSPRLFVDARLASDADRLHSPGATLRMQVFPETFATWTDQADEQGPAPRLLAPFTLEVNVPSLSVPRRDGELIMRESQGELTMRTDQIRLDVPERGEVALRDVGLKLTSPQAFNEQMQMTLNAVASYGGVERPVQASVTVDGALGEQLAERIRLNTQALPVALVDALAGLDGKAVTSLGDTVSANIDSEIQDDGTLAFTGSIDAPQLTGGFEGTGTWTDETRRLEVRTPQPMRAVGTPAMVDAWFGEETRVNLVEPTPMTIDLNNRFALTLRDPGQVEQAEQGGLLAHVDPAGTRIGAVITVPQGAVQSREGGTRVGARNLRINMPERSLTEVVEVIINATIEDVREAVEGEADGAADAAGTGGTIDARANISELVGEDGTLQLANARIVSEATLKDVPSSMFTVINENAAPAAALLGNTISGQTRLDYQDGESGALSMDLQGQNVTGRAVTDLDRRARAHLRDPVTFRVQHTNDVSQVMLLKFNPMLASVVRTTGPIELWLATDPSTVPVKDFNWKQVNAAGRLTMPRFSLEAPEYMGPLFTILQATNTINSRRLYQISVPPTDFTIRRGVLRYDSMPLEIAENVVLDFGGAITLSDKTVDMQVTLKGSEMPRELRGLAIPLTGKLSAPEPDFDKLDDALMRRGVELGLEELLDRAGDGDDQDGNGRNQGGDGNDLGEDLFEHIQREIENREDE